MSTGATNPEQQLVGDWRLTNIGGEYLPDDKTASMTFAAGRLEINVGCNTISAIPVFGPGTVAFRDISSTQMACPPDVQARETQIQKALQRIGAVTVGADDSLSFYDAVNTLQIGAVRY